MSFVIFVNGLVLILSAAAMALIALIFPETRGPFEEAALLVGTLGALLCITTSRDLSRFRRLHGFLLTSSVWLTAAAAGSFPLWLWGMDETDAFFEAMSGISTTGATVMSGLDDTPHGILMWRAVLQWAGGIGFIVTGMALLPMLRVGGMQLFRLESSDKGDRELVNAARFASATLWVYLSLTVLCALLYALGGMTIFEAIAHALTTLSTGGYSTSDSSFGHFTSPFLQWTGTAFMLAGGLPFAWYIRGLTRGLWESEQVSALLQGLLVVILALTLLHFLTSEAGLEESLRHVAFSVISVVTTTGFATVDYTTWGPPAVVIFFLLTAFGGCTGSTAGGVKTMRWIILWRLLRVRLEAIHSPHAVHTMRYESRVVAPDQLAGVIAFFSVFFLSFTVLAIALALLGLDAQTAISGALTSLTNVGPGVGEIIGPSGNFATLPDTAKWVLALGMYLGRLEMLTVFVLLVPSFWRELA